MGDDNVDVFLDNAVMILKLVTTRFWLGELSHYNGFLFFFESTFFNWFTVEF